MKKTYLICLVIFIVALMATAGPIFPTRASKREGAASGLRAKPGTFRASQQDGRVRSVTPSRRQDSKSVSTADLLAPETSDRLPLVEANPDFPGTDPELWRARVATSAQIRYRNVFPGVDLVFAGDQGNIEAVWIVNPGVTPQVIRHTLPGVQSLSVDTEGNMLAQQSASAAGSS